MSTVLSTQPSHEIDLDVQKVVLDVVNRKIKGLDTRVDGSIVGGELERTIEGASTLTLTLHDPKHALLNSGMFAYLVDVRLDRLFWRLVKIGKTGDDLNLTFEDREVALLRGKRKPRKAKRGKVTRAQFALSLVREVRPTIPFVCPELRQRQPIAGSGDRRKLKKALPYQFRRGGQGGPEDSWTALQRLAEEVGWRCFMSAGRLWFISETELLKASPRLVLTPTSPGLNEIDFDLDVGKKVNTASLTARASRWVAAPGAVVQLADYGPADGKWLVSALNRGLFDAEATIALKRPAKKLAEPAPEEASAPRRRRTPAGTTKAGKAYSAARAISQKRYPYVWGGGHGAAGSPSGGGYDCSGAVCAVLAAAGMGFSPGGRVSVSGALESWGEAGKGQIVTVYANDEHVFMVFEGSGGDMHFGTGDWGSGWGGAGFKPQMHPTSRFKARHWPGT